MSFVSALIETGWWLLPLISLIFVVRVTFIWMTIQRHRASLDRPPRSSVPLKTLVVLGSGGHTTEMIQMINHLDPKMYAPLLYVVASTDDTSERRLAAAEKGRSADAIYKIPRSREVGQSYFTSIATTLWSFVWALWLVGKIRPQLLVCNGPGTCLPVAIATFLYRILGLCEGNLVFVESFCRVKSLSLTGHLLYPLADLFVVHWQELQVKYPRSHTVSTFVS